VVFVVGFCMLCGVWVGGVGVVVGIVFWFVVVYFRVFVFCVGCVRVCGYVFGVVEFWFFLAFGFCCFLWFWVIGFWFVCGWFL